MHETAMNKLQNATEDVSLKCTQHVIRDSVTSILLIPQNDKSNKTYI